MGWEQRSRRKLPSGTICYLCGHPISPEQPWDRDHVPPERFYGKSVRRQHSPNLTWLYTHRVCNQTYRPDEEYYVAAFAPFTRSDTGRSVVADFQRGVDKGHHAGLLQTILDQYSKVLLPDGSRVLNYDTDRAGRITWKLIRGLYFLDVARFLPEHTPKRLILIDPKDNKSAPEKYPYFELVRNTEPMGRHGRVFDYKWLGVRFADDKIRAHLVAMLLWEHFVFIVMFHDPSCVCDECQEARITPQPAQLISPPDPSATA